MKLAVPTVEVPLEEEDELNERMSVKLLELGDSANQLLSVFTNNVSVYSALSIYQLLLARTTTSRGRPRAEKFLYPPLLPERYERANIPLNETTRQLILP